MDDRPSYWQQRYDNARPAGALLWCADHRRVVRSVLALVVAMTLGLLVWAAIEGGPVISPILNVLTFSLQLFFWGYAVPRKVDEWRTRRADVENSSHL